MTAQAGRGRILFGFWLLGYALGFAAYLVRVPFIIALEELFSSSVIVGAMISGLAGSIVMLAALYVWSHMGSQTH
jgi:hypothetical protein